MLRRDRKRITPFDNDRFAVHESLFIGPSPWSSPTKVSRTRHRKVTDSGQRKHRMCARAVRVGITGLLRNCFMMMEFHNLLSATTTLFLLFVRFISSIKVVRCAVALSPLYPSSTSCSSVPYFLEPLCHMLQELPTGEDLCTQPLYNPLEPLLKGLSLPNVDLRFIHQYLERNLASENNGATIIRELTSVTHGRVACTGASEGEVLACNLRNNGHINTPAVVLEDDFRLSEYWEFAGGSGQIAINLSNATVITKVAIDYPNLLHLNPAAHLRIPKQMSLWVLLEDPQDLQGSREQDLVSLPVSYFHVRPSQSRLFPHISSPPPPTKGSFIQVTKFTYKSSLGQPTRQFFAIDHRWQVRTNIAVLRIEGNYGGETTCLYWVGIFGYV